jgi:exopolysaccharide biosynthesis protein
MPTNMHVAYLGLGVSCVMEKSSGIRNNAGHTVAKYYAYGERRNARTAGMEGFDRAPKKKTLPVWFVITADVLLAALLLGIFYVTNYEVKSETGPIASLPVPSWFTSAPPAPTAEAPSAPADTDAAAVQTPAADPNDWRAKFPGKFTDGAVEQTENSYRSANISVSVEEVQKFDAPCYIADIYVAELKYFRTAFAKDPGVMGSSELTDKVAQENDAIVAINGDHCTDNEGTVVRNGQLFRKPKSSLDVLVMNYDGSMKTYSPDEFDVEKTLSEGVYQVWTFGPMLLRDGQPMTQFNSTVTGLNPRTAVGYYEPGHYCFVVVGGRHEDYSEGCTMTQLSGLFYDLHCTEAYNLDGGQSSEFIFLGGMLNEQTGGRRSTPDILYIADK